MDADTQLMPLLISGANFLLHFMNQFHLFMLIAILILFSSFSFHHSFTQNSNLTFLVYPSHHKSLTIDTLADFLG